MDRLPSLTPETYLSITVRVTSPRHFARLLATAATAGLICAFHMSHDERQACNTSASVFAAPVGASPTACIAAPRI